MSLLKLDFRWRNAGSDAPEIHQTMGHFGLRVGDTNLTENEDICSRTICDTVLVSAYPLAQWIASSFNADPKKDSPAMTP